MFYWNLFFYQIDIIFYIKNSKSFNPCFIGTYSFTPIKKEMEFWTDNVLILVLLELILLHLLNFSNDKIYQFVLILVLLELILLQDLDREQVMMLCCFNPCFIGTYSFTCNWSFLYVCFSSVLILVLLELILLLETSSCYNLVHFSCFNPCFIGTYSFTNV